MTFQAVADTSEVTPDRPLAVEVGDVPVAIVVDQDQWYAIHNVCSHGHVPLSEGEVDDGGIECYLHGSVFDLATGRPRCLPATAPVPVYPCRVEGTTIEVDVDNPITEPQES